MPCGRLRSRPTSAPSTGAFRLVRLGLPWLAPTPPDPHHRSSQPSLHASSASSTSGASSLLLGAQDIALSSSIVRPSSSSVPRTVSTPADPLPVLPVKRRAVATRIRYSSPPHYGSCVQNCIALVNVDHNLKCIAWVNVI
jgi:hypothetical protein